MRPPHRLLGLILAPALLLIASPAHASSLYASFSGTFDTTYAADGTSTPVTDYAGHTFTGSLVMTLDADASLTPSTLHYLENKISSFTVSVDGTPFSFPFVDINQVVVADNFGLGFGGSDNVGFQYGVISDPNALLNSNSISDTLWSSTAVPDVAALNSLTGWTFELTLPNPTGPASRAHADDVTVSFSDTAPVTAVPTPAAAFAALPLLALTYATRRRRSHSA